MEYFYTTFVKPKIFHIDHVITNSDGSDVIYPEAGRFVFLVGIVLWRKETKRKQLKKEEGNT